MEMNFSQRAKCEKMAWSLYIPKEEAAARAAILSALAKASHATKPATHPWRGKDTDMLDLNFAAAEFVADHFPGRRYNRLLFRLVPCRGWMVYMEDGTASIVAQFKNNDSIFRHQRPDRSMQKLRPI